MNVMLLNLWNSLHNDVKLTNTVMTFRRQLNAYLIQLAYTPQCPSDITVVHVEFDTDLNLPNYFVLKRHLALVS